MLTEKHRAALIEDEQALYGPFFGQMGVTFAMVFAACGAAYATAKVTLFNPQKAKINPYINKIIKMMPEKKFGDILNFDQSSQNIQIQVHFKINMIGSISILMQKLRW